VRIITRELSHATAARAEYLDLEQRVVLIGNAARLAEHNVVSGDTITIDLPRTARSSRGQAGTVKAVFYPPRGRQAERAGAHARRVVQQLTGRT